MTEIDNKEVVSTTITNNSSYKPVIPADDDNDEDIDAWMDLKPDQGSTTTTKDGSEEATTSSGAYDDLRQSTMRLGTSLRNIAYAVDSKLNVSGTVKNIDQRTNLSTNVTKGIQKVGQVLSEVDEQYHLRETTSTTIKNINEQYSVRERTVNTAKSVDEKLRLSQTAFNIRKFDEENRLSTQTVEALERGTKLIESKVVTASATTGSDDPTSSTTNVPVAEAVPTGTSNTTVVSSVEAIVEDHDDTPIVGSKKE